MPVEIKQDATVDSSGLVVTCGLLHDVRHAVSTRALAEASSERETLALRLRQTMGWGMQTPIALAEQVHGVEVAVVEAIEGAGCTWHEGADALVTRRAGVMLGIFTADCVPVLFADASAGVIGAVHAGWRGSMGRILERSLEAAFDLGAQPLTTRVWIGPSICQAEYEVSEELARKFAAEFEEHAESIVEGRHVDLPRLNALQALGMGLARANVAMAGLCTRRQWDLLCSYRRDGENAGRMLAGICQ